MPGTLIATPEGPRRVEALAEGDEVLTASGTARRIRWIGHRGLRPAAHPRPETVQPVKIAAGAFGEGLPMRDLHLSPGHGVFVAGAGQGESGQGESGGGEICGGCLIPAALLVNGRTIVQVAWDHVDYVHLELDTHDVVLAEGLPCETYLDAGNRSDFANDVGPIALHPAFAMPISTTMAHEAACAPFVIVGPVVEEVRARLERRADALAGAGAARSKVSLLGLLGRRAR